MPASKIAVDDAYGHGHAGRGRGEVTEHRNNVWPVITLAAAKGGVGKTTIAYEVAGAIGAVLIDFDWDNGGATTMWGDDPTRRVRSPLLNALLAIAPGRDGTLPSAPHFLDMPGRPGLLPGDTRLSDIHAVDSTRLAAMLAQWSAEWNRPIVIDTHPGLGPISDAAMAASTLVAVPMVLGARELDGLHGFLQLRGGGFPIVLIPNKDRASAQDLRLLRVVEGDVRTFGIRVAPSISDWLFLPRRTTRRSALVLTRNPGHDLGRAASEFLAVSQYLMDVIKEGRNSP